MKKTTTVLLLLSMLLALCAGSPAAADARNQYKVEENTAENKVTYPYVVRTESAVWYLAAEDITLLGEGAFYRGLYEILEYQDRDFADARDALSGFIRDEVAPIDIYTDFSGRAGLSETEIVGAYYNSRRNFIKVFRGWEKAKDALLHEYVHYLTLHCTDRPVAHGLFAEGVADYVSLIVCKNRMMRDNSRSMSGEVMAYYKAHGVWDREEDCLDPRLFEFGLAELYAHGYTLGQEYLSTIDEPTVRTEKIQQNPTAENISHMEAACIMAYLVETFSKETVFSHLDMNPADMEQVYGEPFAVLYERWKVWNTEYFNQSGMIL